MTASAISIESVTKSFQRETVLRDIELEVEDGEFCVVLGPSGCGKSTLLKCIAGLIESDDGTISLDGRDTAGMSVQERNLGYVFQEFEETLFPHKTVAENIAFGLEQGEQERSPDEIEETIDDILALLAIEETRDDLPGSLSGGQQQRVELARQLSRECPIMLFDDPLADLDYKLQKRMELEMRSLHADLGSTFLYITHNQDQALKLADKLVVMNHGRIEQIGTPESVYHNPQTAFVCRFVGDSNALVTEGVPTDVGDGVVEVETEIGPITATAQNGAEKETGIVIVRPEVVSLDAADCDVTFTGVLEGKTYTGETTEFALSLEGLDRDFYVVVPNNPDIGAIGDSIELGWNVDDALYFDKLSVTDTVTTSDLLDE
ncbi:ABC transporter ATP-binding protein [Natronorubrum thiooxidans]|uniref:Molybdate/tungstate import ATP-binding protein WtpC n=1 Tax=Natronorubrum thiooxidans TaxID=308853 RepID=A0A1N7GXG4_9EURY|nr:ABC transporter ATP-binding protein [Natronorubrum thiooxidans]SIS17230.1 thiamine transport system ATP-binding protein/multiple sugar transport system ATP-binding protein/spermidine/putrescine transport system ATP-binding protein [Natronorubrum thiooxidans]